MDSSGVRIALRLAYEGSAYHGWQLQKGVVSVQEVLTQKISMLLKHPVHVWGCGRTDTGVHARDFMAHFDTHAIPDYDFVHKLNQVLPDDIVIYEAYEAVPRFSSRHHCISRTYRYQTTLAKNPFMLAHAWRLYKKPDAQRLQEGCHVLLQTKDFKAFAKSKSAAKHTLCHLTEARVEFYDPFRMDFVFTANRFLRNMVRAMVGTLMDVGHGKISIEKLQEVIETGDRRLAGESVPAKGLFLEKVVYPEGLPGRLLYQLTEPPMNVVPVKNEIE